MADSINSAAEQRAFIKEHFAAIRARFEDQMPQVRAALQLAEYQNIDAVIAAERAKIDTAEWRALAEVDNRKCS